MAAGVAHGDQRSVQPIERRRDVLGEVGDGVEGGGAVLHALGECAHRLLDRADRAPDGRGDVLGDCKGVVHVAQRARDELQAGRRTILQVTDQLPRHDGPDETRDRGDDRGDHHRLADAVAVEESLSSSRALLAGR